MACHYCGSEYHFSGNCDKRKKEAKIVEDGSKGEAEDGFSWIVVLEEVEKNPEEADIANVSLALICEETEGKRVLDCACTSPIAGENWIQGFIKGLPEEDKKNILEEKSTKNFKFGGGEIRSSIKCVNLLVEVAGVKGTITTDIGKADLPLLLGMPVLKRAKIVINFDTAEAMIFGKKLTLQKLSTGHYVVPLRPNYQKVEPDVCLRTYEINSKVEKERLCALKKLHEQMAHAAQVKLEALIKNAGKWMASKKKELGTIYSQCETCKISAKTPARSVVAAMPKASTFNEVLTLDLRIRERKLILYMIDNFSRCTKGVFIKSKKLAEVVNAIMLH